MDAETDTDTERYGFGLIVRLQKPKPHEAAAKLQANRASYTIQIQSEYESDSYDNRRLLLDWILDSLPCLLFN